MGRKSKLQLEHEENERESRRNLKVARRDHPSSDSFSKAVRNIGYSLIEIEHLYNLPHREISNALAYLAISYVYNDLNNDWDAVARRLRKLANRYERWALEASQPKPEIGAAKPKVVPLFTKEQS